MVAELAQAPALSVAEAILARRKVPCICPRQHEADPPVGRTLEVSTSRGLIVEAVECSACGRTWTRIDAC